MEHLANILTGEMNSIIKSYHHDKLEFFGAGKDHSAKFWNAVIHQGLVLHLLHKDIESYGLISVTDHGRAFFENPYELMLTEDREFAEGEDDDEETAAAAAAARGGGGGDPALLAMLKDLRRDVARKKGLQPWVIFGDPSLEDMSIMYPISCDELKKLYEIMVSTKGIYGGRFSGAGFKGCCMALIDPAYEESIVKTVTAEYLKAFPELEGKFSCHICESADGINLEG